MLEEVPTSAFERFLALADWLYAETGATHKIALERLFDLVYRWLINDGFIELEVAQQAILADYQKSGSKGRLSFMTRGFTAADDLAKTSKSATPQRQRRHLATQDASL